ITLLAQLREKSQLIVITHQKRTMEIADALYGARARPGRRRRRQRPACRPRRAGGPAPVSRARRAARPRPAR
ncbi:hypothetical protein, partial [Micromonospora profundi]|uniref:hypothetical protein n=1 Tax=Micromonospora profundi TaxID=1420889 RepID=UPI003F54163F